MAACHGQSPGYVLRPWPTTTRLSLWDTNRLPHTVSVSLMLILKMETECTIEYTTKCIIDNFIPVSADLWLWNGLDWLTPVAQFFSKHEFWIVVLGSSLVTRLIIFPSTVENSCKSGPDFVIPTYQQPTGKVKKRTISVLETLEEY